MQFKNLSGQQIGDWHVIERVANGGPKSTITQFLCRCACGNEAVVQSCNLRSGSSQRCNVCARARRGYTYVTRHGHGQRHSGTYRSWMRIRQHVNNPNDPKYADFGGRGIKICAGWNSFKQFWADMDTRPDGTTLDRIDSSAHYSCGHCGQCVANGWPPNCRWVTPTEQANNRRPRERSTDKA